MNAPDPTAAETVREQIVDAAEARFQTYGYRKTTMAEIAADCGMSAANLYRYFENKQDIAAACAGRCMAERIELLRRAIDQPGLRTAQRLEAFALTLLHYTHQFASEQPHINELVETIATERLDAVQHKNQAEQALIAELLTQGNARGEFHVPDVAATARHVHASLLAFGMPIFMGLYPLQEFEELARGTAQLLVRGLAR